MTGMALAARTDAPLPRGFARLSGRRSNHGAARGNSRRAAPTAVTLTSTRHTGPKFAARRPARAANLGRERDRAPDSFRWRGPAFLRKPYGKTRFSNCPSNRFEQFERRFSAPRLSAVRIPEATDPRAARHFRTVRTAFLGDALDKTPLSNAATVWHL